MAPEQRRTHHPTDFAQQLVLASQASFNLSYEVFRKRQVIKGFLEGLGGVLRLAAVALEAFSSGATPALSRFGMFFGASFGWGHSVLQCAVSGLLCHALPGLPAFFCQPSAL
jgi:hypothetical protein